MGSDQHFRSADRIGRHAMPFGAEVLAEGGVRFRLWAPAARKVELVVANKSKSLNPLDSGWFELVERDAAAGTLYQYRIDGRQLVPDPASRFQPKDVDGPSEVDRKSTRLNSSHSQISYAVFCLKKKNIMLH